MPMAEAGGAGPPSERLDPAAAAPARRRAQEKNFFEKLFGL